MKTVATIFIIIVMFYTPCLGRMQYAPGNLICSEVGAFCNRPDLRTIQTDSLPTNRIQQDSLDAEVRKKKEALVLAMTDVRMEYFIIHTESHQFGYYIMLDGRIYIEQTTIPAIQGLQGFISKDEATSVAEFVIDKIKQGVVPPLVTMEELNQLSITLPR